MQSNTNDRPVAVVFGATGAQGGAVARALLADGGWAVRVITRRPQSLAAKALHDAGAFVLPGDLSEKSTLRDLVSRAEVVFGVTNFWEHFGNEYLQGRNLIEVLADSSSLAHFVFSTQPSAQRRTFGELSVPQLDIKAQLERESRELGLPATYVHVALYYQNFVRALRPRLADDGAYVLSIPQGETPLATVDVEDVGAVVASIVAKRSAYRGRTVGIVGDEQTMADYAAIMSVTSGHVVRFEDIETQAYASQSSPAAAELAAEFDFYKRYTGTRLSDLAECARLTGSMQSFAHWMTTHGEALLPSAVRAA